MDRTIRCKGQEQPVLVTAGPVMLKGNLVVPPEGVQGCLLFVCCSGSRRNNPRNYYVAHMMREAKLATLLIDLLTPDEETIDLRARHFCFDIGLFAERLVSVTDWLTQNLDISKLKLGYFVSSTGGGAALVAAAERPDTVSAIVSYSGNLDLAWSALPRVQAPTLLIVGGNDLPRICMHQDALTLLRVEKRLEIIPETTSLFAEPGALEEMARLASQWFKRFLSFDQSANLS